MEMMESNESESFLLDGSDRVDAKAALLMSFAGVRAAFLNLLMNDFKPFGVLLAFLSRVRDWQVASEAVRVVMPKLLVTVDTVDSTEMRELAIERASSCCSSSAPAAVRLLSSRSSNCSKVKSEFGVVACGCGWSCSCSGEGPILLVVEGEGLFGALGALKLVVLVLEAELADRALPAAGGPSRRVRNGCPSATRCLLTRRAKPSRVRAERSSRSSASAESASARSRPLGSRVIIL